LSFHASEVKTPPMRLSEILTLVGMGILLSGCIEREMTITSNPPGALVFISDVEKGRTPLTTEFTWYGDHDIILRASGYETLKTHAHIDPPIYAIPPFDLFSSIAPWTYHDRRYLHFDLRKLSEPTNEELIRRADALSERNRQPVER